MSAQLKRAIEESGYPLAQLAEASGVDRGRLSRFVRGERDLSLAAAEKICDALGYRLVKSARPKAPPPEDRKPGRKPKAKG